MIEICNVCKSFDDRTILNNVSFKIDEGDTFVLMGKSGVGKSVLIRLLIGLDKPDSGQILLNGVDMCTLHGQELFQATEQMGLLFQSGALFDSMNVFDNIIFPLYIHRLEKGKDLRKIALEALSLVDLHDESILDKLPSELSGGMKKRVALARLIAYRPRILLFDEPTTGLDPLTSRVIIDTMISIQQALKSTMIIVTHDLILAASLGKRIALIDRGEVEIVKTTKDFFQHQGNEMIDYFRSLLPKTILQAYE